MWSIKNIYGFSTDPRCNPLHINDSPQENLQYSLPAVPHTEPRVEKKTIENFIKFSF